MTLASAIEGGLAGATTISLLGETLRKIDGKSPGANGIKGKKLKKRFKKAGSKKRHKATEEYVKLAGDLLGAASVLGFTSLGKKKNAVLRGALLGTAAGLGAVLLEDYSHKKDNDKVNGHEGFPSTMLAKDTVLQKALQVGLFTAGGMIAGKLMQGAGKKKRKRKK
jgi:hypothetical protein